MRILTFGTFDHLHPGHRFFIERAQERGDLTIVVARDVTAEKIKGRKPDQTEDERKAGLEQAYPGVTVMLGNSGDYLDPVRKTEPDVILLGYDQTFPPGVKEGDLPCPVERLEAYKPEEYKSSIRNGV